MPIPVREWLLEQYVESIKRDPKHPITSEAAFDALRRVKTPLTLSTGAVIQVPLCRDWYMVTGTSVKNLVSSFRSRKNVVALMKQMARGGGAGAGAGARDRAGARSGAGAGGGPQAGAGAGPGLGAGADA